MHDIEPYYHWRGHYTSEEDERSPFFGREYSEFMFTNKVYNYFIHPQWDEFGSPTLYLKVLWADYENGFAIIELIGEWNDCIHNDIMFLKREVIDSMTSEGISKFILIGENVLNFHADDDSYYEEWYEDVSEEAGWVVCLNLLEHVMDEFKSAKIHHYLNFGGVFNTINWRPQRPDHLYRYIDKLLSHQTKSLSY